MLWAFDGWADLSFVSGEVKDPRRVLPRAIILGTCAVIAIYLLANLAYLAVLPVDEIRHSKLVAADVAQRLIGAPGVVFVATTVMLSTFGTLNATLLTAPRVFFAMADDGLFFRRVASVHPRFGTPSVAILLAAALGVVFVLLQTFEQLADTFVTAIVPFYALAVAAIFVVRKRPDYDPPFRTPLYPDRARAVHPRDALPPRQRAPRSDEPVADARGAGDHSGSASRCTMPPSDAPRRSEPERPALLLTCMTDKHDLPGLRGLEVIAGFKFLQALTLILAGLGSFGLMNPGVSDAAGDWLERLAVGNGQRFAVAAATRILPIFNAATPRHFAAFGLGALLYASVFLVEGIGLWRGKKWAEYLTIAVTRRCSRSRSSPWCIA